MKLHTSRWALRFRKRVLSRMTGPVLSLIIHVGLLVLIVLCFTLPTKHHPKPEKMEIMFVEADSIPDFDPSPFDPDPYEMDETVLPDSHEMVEAMLPTENFLFPEADIVSVSSMQVDPAISPLHIQLGQASFSELNGREQTMFGAVTGAGGDLVGTLYDLKRDRKGRPRDPAFAEDISRMIKRGFTRHAFSPFYRVPQQVYFNHLMMDKVPAEEGPRVFGVEEYMEPSQFVVHYKGEIQAPATGRYRFVGEFDDILVVMIDGQPVLEAGWGEKVTDWQPSEFVDAHLCYTEHPLVYGDWFHFDATASHRIDILIGEEPGGYIGGLLMVQQENIQYQTARNGRPILPLFTVQPLTVQDRERMVAFSSWQFDRRPPPIMGKRRDMQLSRKNDDVNVIIR